MKKFLVLYHSTPEDLAQFANATPEQTEAVMGQWMAWNERSGNQIVDLGAPLMGGQLRSNSTGWSNSNVGISGYSIVQGEDVDSVRALFENHPHLMPDSGNRVEIQECMSM